MSSEVEKQILNAKENLPEVTPTPPDFKNQSTAHDLKSRLEWGEPGLTILDVNDRETFNDGHIMGAVAMPMDEVVDRAKGSLENNRDIYVYGASDEETSTAASHLRQAGFNRVAELRGGLAGWKALGGPTEGRKEALTPPTAGDYNVVARIQESQGKH